MKSGYILHFHNGRKGIILNLEFKSPYYICTWFDLDLKRKIGPFHFSGESILKTEPTKAGQILFGETF